MSEKKDKDLIGFDPLAWMDDNSNETGDSEQQSKEPVTVEVAAVTDIEASEPIAEPELATDFKLTLDAMLNIQNVSDLHERLLVLLEQKDKIEIDASAVDSIDTATLQLLIVLKQTAIKLHKDVVFDFPSDKFVESAELLGLATMLEVDQPAAGFF